MAKKKNSWKDHYTSRAKDEKWLARSVYKLEEIDKKYKFIKKGCRILDLGCYPGSWTQYCLKKLGNNGEIIGIDLNRPTRFKARNFRFIAADILELDPGQLAGEVGQLDAVISDLAPNTTGNSIADTARSMELVEKALEIALSVLKKEAHFLCKIFEGEDLKGFKDRVSAHFNNVRLIRPAAVRKKSREVYLIGMDMIDQNSPSKDGEIFF
ncbi:MAG: RlmE family RNA methyltransferase [Deltaproteobacteria bacterium]|nr:RlmE family RNA methyltransferase [Deltaproteobacteria bacterium]